MKSILFAGMIVSNNFLHFRKLNSTRLTGRFLLVVFLILQCFSAAVLGQTIRFANIGDYGDAGQDEQDVSALIRSWNVDFIFTNGDNNYPDGETSTIDDNIGQYYREYIGNYQGSYPGNDPPTNRFFPSLGNHDWHTKSGNPEVPHPYLDYFTLPGAGILTSGTSGNERYYDFIIGPVHFFALDSDSDEPDGRISTSTQGQWLQTQLAASTSSWKVVFMHHAPFSSSSNHGSVSTMQWPYEDWGADVVFAGHDHTYERILKDDNGDDVIMPYFVNGLGGRSRYSFGSPISGSQVRYRDDYGAMLIEVNDDSITFQFYTHAGQLIDTYTMRSRLVDLHNPVPNAQPERYNLRQNFPNPFNPTTKIEFSIPPVPMRSGKSEFVTLKVYNLLGEEVATLVSETLAAGSYKSHWDASSLGSGVYLYKIQAGGFVKVKKMILLK